MQKDKNYRTWYHSSMAVTSLVEELEMEVTKILVLHHTNDPVANAMTVLRTNSNREKISQVAIFCVQKTHMGIF